jgi:hypothetical protein
MLLLLACASVCVLVGICVRLYACVSQLLWKRGGLMSLVEASSAAVESVVSPAALLVFDC